MDIGIATFIIAAVVSIWGIIQVFITNKLEREVNRLNLKTSQSLQMLYRARDAAIEWHKNHIFLMEYKKNTEGKLENIDWNIYATKHADLSAYHAELKGLAFAIGDETLRNIVKEQIVKSESFEFLVGGTAITDYGSLKMDVMEKFQKIHMRIAELIIQETAKAD